MLSQDWTTQHMDFSDSSIYFLKGQFLFWAVSPPRVLWEAPCSREKEPSYWSAAQHSSSSVLGLGLRPNKSVLLLPQLQGPHQPQQFYTKRIKEGILG